MPLPPYRRPGRGQPLAGAAAARLQRDVQNLSDVTASGDIGVDEGNGGRQIFDARPKSFPGRITAHVADNAYGFVRVDDGRGDGTFPDLDETTEAGDGESLVAWELNGRDDVDVDTLVQLEPCLLGPGYQFTAGSASGGGGTAGCEGCGWLAGLGKNHCLKLTVIAALGRCDCIDDGQELILSSTDGITWTVDPDYNDPADFSACAAGFTVAFTRTTCGVPCLSLTTTGGGSGGETTSELYFACCTRDRAEFTGNGTLCAGDADDDADADPADNLFRLRVEWVPDLVCHPAPVVTECCPDNPIPPTLTVTIGGSGAITGSGTLVYDIGTDKWVGEVTFVGDSCGAGLDSTMEIQCQPPGPWYLFIVPGAGSFATCGTDGASGLTQDSCDPFQLSAHFPSGFCRGSGVGCCCGQDITITVTA